MFTGIVQSVGKIGRIERVSRGMRLTVETGVPGEPFAAGESVAVDGACLTVAGPTAGGFQADVSEETVSRTTLGECRPGMPVNLERSLRLSDRLGGHIVTGHIDGVGQLLDRRPAGNSRAYTFSAPESLRSLIAEKGSIAVDGISLTVAAVTPAGFEVAVIPHTELSTSLGRKPVGSRVNLEADILARYVQNALSAGVSRSGAEGRLGALLGEYLG